MLLARVTACIFSQLNPHVSLTLYSNHRSQEYFYALCIVPLASGILHDSENITMQLERQLVYNVK